MGIRDWPISSGSLWQDDYAECVSSENVIWKSIGTICGSRFSVLSYEFPVPRKIFPVSLSRECGSKAFKSLGECDPLSRKLARN
jgi:hypothetical protein